jgi:hypothetical protein
MYETMASNGSFLKNVAWDKVKILTNKGSHKSWGTKWWHSHNIQIFSPLIRHLDA